MFSHERNSPTESPTKAAPTALIIASWVTSSTSAGATFMATRRRTSLMFRSTSSLSARRASAGRPARRAWRM